MRALALSLLLVVSAAALGQSPLAIAKGKAAEERKANLALDTAWFERNETADYVEIGKDGRRKTKAQSVAEMKQMGKMLKVKSMTVDVLSAKMVGKDVVSQVKVHVVGTLPDPQGKSHTFDFTETAEDTWTKAGGGWKKRLEKTLTQTGMIDGKAMPSR